MKHNKLINLCYRERGKTLSDIYEIQIMAHSVHDAVVKFNGMQLSNKIVGYRYTGGKLKYVVLAGAVVR